MGFGRRTRKPLGWYSENGPNHGSSLGYFAPGSKSGDRRWAWQRPDLVRERRTLLSQDWILNCTSMSLRYGEWLSTDVVKSYPSSKSFKNDYSRSECQGGGFSAYSVLSPCIHIPSEKVSARREGMQSNWIQFRIQSQSTFYVVPIWSTFCCTCQAIQCLRGG